MKSIATIVVLTFACLGTATMVETPVSDLRVPSLQDTQRIYIDTNNGWRLRINTDGSANLQFGSSPIDSAKCPARTFVLSEIYNLLVPKLKEKRDENDIAVVIWSSGVTSTTAQYINRSEVKPIFTKAQQQSMALDKTRFDALIKDRPIELKTPSKSQ
jgi:hypothetical protein